MEPELDVNGEESKAQLGYKQYLQRKVESLAQMSNIAISGS